MHHGIKHSVNHQKVLTTTSMSVMNFAFIQVCDLDFQVGGDHCQIWIGVLYIHHWEAIFLIPKSQFGIL